MLRCFPWALAMLIVLYTRIVLSLRGGGGIYGSVGEFKWGHLHMYNNSLPCVCSKVRVLFERGYTVSKGKIRRCEQNFPPDHFFNLTLFVEYTSNHFIGKRVELEVGIRFQIHKMAPAGHHCHNFYRGRSVLVFPIS